MCLVCGLLGVARFHWLPLHLANITARMLALPERFVFQEHRLCKEPRSEVSDAIQQDWTDHRISLRLPFKGARFIQHLLSTGCREYIIQRGKIFT